MKHFLSTCLAAFIGSALVAVIAWAICRQCCMMKKCCPAPPCRIEQKCCPQMHHHPCCKKKAGEHHRNPAMTEMRQKMKTRFETLRTLREKHPDAMLAIDMEFVAAEDKIAALAVQDGLELPKNKIDFRRIRIAFPEEMKALDAQSKTMKPHEYFEAVKKLAEKLEQ
ncbi:MAG: hypothetical protein MJ016_01660 [Victivallaceae bacterium]|nr:hypothetical protein [Victivallaceae bacterium]